MVPLGCPARHWGVIIAVVGYLIPETPLARPQNDQVSPTPNRQAEQNQPSAEPPPPVKFQDPEQADGYRADCDKPKDREDSDLCAQWGAVEAVRQANRISDKAVVTAERANEIERESLRWTTFEFAALLATLLATAWAARAASRAAVAAETAVHVSETTAEKQLRAYVHISKVKLGPLSASTPINVRIMAQNCGQTPAVRVEFWHGIVVARLDEKIDFGSLSLHRDDGVFVIPTDIPAHYSLTADKPIGSDGFATAMSKAGTIYIFGRLCYIDAFKQPHTTNFRLAWDSSSGGFAACPEGNDAD